MKLLVLSALASAMLFTTACSTTAHFTVPADSKLTVYERPVPAGGGTVKTSPFFWTASAGVPYKLEDRNGNVLREGKLKSRFRVMSIFWPPFALIYWPMGFGSNQYDLTKEADGYWVRDTVSNKPAPAAPAKTKKK